MILPAIESILNVLNAYIARLLTAIDSRDFRMLKQMASAFLIGLCLSSISQAAEGTFVPTFGRGQQQEAQIEAIRQAIHVDPTQSELFVQLGDALLVSKKSQEALQAYSKALSIDPDSVRGLCGRGYALLSISAFDRALQDLDRAIRIDTNCAAAYAHRGMTYLLLGKAELAVADLSHVIRLHPTDAKAFGSRACAFVQLRKYPQAMNDYNTAVRLDPQNELRYLDRAILGLLLGEYEKAEGDIKEVLRIKADSPDGLFVRASLHYRNGQYSQAVVDLRRTIEINNGFTAAYGLLGKILATCPDENVRDGRQAVDHATSACERTSWCDHTELATLACAYAENNNFEAAVEWQRKAIEKAPKNKVDEYNRRLELFLKSKPLRETSADVRNADRERLTQI